MKRLVTLSLWIAVVALLGCATETGTGAGSAGLTVVDKALVESQLLYLDLDVSEAPLTAAELGDVSQATPVRVTFEDGWALARFAPEGEALGGIENVMGAWRIDGEIETIDGELTPGTTPTTTTVPGFGVTVPGLDNRLDMAPISSPVRSIRNEGTRAPYARLDWFKARLQEWATLPGGAHPGCL